jgi:agmatine deiminase
MSTPASEGYRMPAEWEPHEATWLSWPRRDGVSFPGSYDRVVPVFVKMVEALATSEKVRINVSDTAMEKELCRLLSRVPAGQVEYFPIETNEPWCRDHGPVFVTRQRTPSLAVVDFGYNAWGWKYPPFDADDEVPTKVAKHLGLKVFDFGDFVLEGGSIDVNGHGAVLTTESCLLNPNRNPSLDRRAIEEKLKKTLGVSEVLWLGDGIEGDDTDGHVDDITRFVSEDTVVTAVEENEDDPNYEPLQANFRRLESMSVSAGKPLRILKLPMPPKMVREGHRLPASYANFYIANRVILLPVFNDPADHWARSVLHEAFPDREIVPIDCRELIWGLGAFHCLTQQQPALPNKG